MRTSIFTVKVTYRNDSTRIFRVRTNTAWGAIYELRADRKIPNNAFRIDARLYRRDVIVYLEDLDKLSIKEITKR